MPGHPVLVFVLLAFGWSWALELSARALDGTPSDALHLAAKFGPSLAGLAAAWLCGGRAELRALVSRVLRWRVAVGWYAFALFAPLALWMLANSYVVAARSFVDFDLAAFAMFFPLTVKHFALGGGLGEEIGWRGFLQSTLERRHGVVATSAAIGVIWGLWHAPVFLLPTAGRTGGAGLLALFTLLCMAYSLIFARILHGARDSVMIVALMHASTNAAERAVKDGFPNLHGEGLVPLIYGGFVIALGLAALVVQLPSAPQPCSDSSQPQPTSRPS